jgi:outer membrane protein assembly factor BamD (BamD/ComL family)
MAVVAEALSRMVYLYGYISPSNADKTAWAAETFLANNPKHESRAVVCYLLANTYARQNNPARAMPFYTEAAAEESPLPCA